MTKVLLIEDNKDIRENVLEILELSGYEAFSASNGLLGVEEALKHVPDIILCDIMMPELDGYGVLEALGNYEQTSAIPFIFLTAKAERPDIRKGMELGADDYLTKPFDDTDLLNAIESRLKKRGIHQVFYGKSAQQLEEVISKKDGWEELKNIMEDRSGRKFKKSQHIHYEGDRVTGIYYIISGAVKTVKLTEDGRELITGIYKANDYLDLNIVLSQETYDDTAVALEDTVLSFLPVEQLDKMLYLYPDVGAKFIKMLSNNIREREMRLMQIAYYSVRKRIAECLIRLLQKHTTGDSNIKISREDLASLAGTSPETVSRTLTDFKSEGLIDKSGSNIKILNRDKLNSMKN
ncbi:response regulator [Flavobacterium sp. J372]|uniref:response regulator n=1 Tax=Flavobacterium sp. J372 TaxID=2898436 RepID=UPI0021512FE1|nr:response regulator [Flavobacterium sp. J372]MCR5862780.1 response regulator [Flavobacterium sp. J372]